MRLRRDPTPTATGTATFYWIHVGHRNTAIQLAIGLIRDAATREIATVPADVFTEMGGVMTNWAIESLLQGAWLREYHVWERDTKRHFNNIHLRNGGKKIEWKRNAQSHVAKVRQQLKLFSVTMSPDILSAIDGARVKINTAKHEDDIWASEADYQLLVASVQRFWQELEPQEIWER